MGVRIYALLRLKPGVAPEDYERWVREVDYPLSSQFPQLRSYTVMKLTERIFSDETERPWDYLELIEPTDYDEYMQAIVAPALQGFFEQWASFVGDHVVLRAEPVE